MPGSGVRVSPQLLEGSPAESNGVHFGRRFAFPRGRICPKAFKGVHCNPICLGLSMGVSAMSRPIWGYRMASGSLAKGRSTNRLSDRTVRAFLSNVRAGKAATKKLSDGGGLFITTTPAGSAVWRLKYRHGGKEKLYAIGVYPTIGLERARVAREAVKAHLSEGREPVKARQLSRASAVASSVSTFGAAAESWLDERRKEWSVLHYQKSKRALERDVLPLLGKLPIADVTPAMIARAIEAIMKRGAAETASKTLWHCVCIFRLAQARGLVRENAAVPVREVLPRRKLRGQRPALLDVKDLGDLLRRMATAPLTPAVRVAHRLVAFTAGRVGNVVEAEWKEFELDSDLPAWTVPRKKMKTRVRKFDHRVYLAPTIAAELRIWRGVSSAHGYLFRSQTTGKPITREALEKSLRVTLGMEGKHSVHGWRSSFATLARDAGFSRDVVELTLDHVHDNEVARAYDRGERLVERRRLMYWWDAQLSGAQHGATVIPLGPTGAA
jgi:integrase